MKIRCKAETRFDHMGREEGGLIVTKTSNRQSDRQVTGTYIEEKKRSRRIIKILATEGKTR